jgi:ElaB/YqjD/DUF883 family membrane-anchored ribosome-binding protein
MKEHTVPSTTISNEKLHEAMTLLNEAAQAKRDEVRALIDEKYSDLRSVFDDAADASAGWVRKTGGMVVGNAKKAASTVDESVHENAWLYVGGAAFGALLLGYVLGRRR